MKFIKGAKVCLGKEGIAGKHDEDEGRFKEGKATRHGKTQKVNRRG